MEVIAISFNDNQVKSNLCNKINTDSMKSYSKPETSRHKSSSIAKNKPENQKAVPWIILLSGWISPQHYSALAASERMQVPDSSQYHLLRNRNCLISPKAPQ